MNPVPVLSQLSHTFFYIFLEILTLKFSNAFFNGSRVNGILLAHASQVLMFHAVLFVPFPHYVYELVDCFRFFLQKSCKLFIFVSKKSHRLQDKFFHLLAFLLNRIPILIENWKDARIVWVDKLLYGFVGVRLPIVGAHFYTIIHFKSEIKHLTFHQFIVSANFVEKRSLFLSLNKQKYLISFLLILF